MLLKFSAICRVNHSGCLISNRPDQLLPSLRPSARCDHCRYRLCHNKSCLARTVPHKVRHVRRCRHIATQTSKRFGERAHIHVDLILKPIVARRAAAAFSDDAEAVCVINHHTSTVLSCKSANIREVRNITCLASSAILGVLHFSNRSITVFSFPVLPHSLQKRV